MQPRSERQLVAKLSADYYEPVHLRTSSEPSATELLMFAESAAWYDRFFETKDYRGEARWVAVLVRRCPPDAGTLPDVACGTGRHLSSCATTSPARGWTWTPGCWRWSPGRLPGIGLTQADMADFDLGRAPFSLVVGPGANGRIRPDPGMIPRLRERGHHGGDAATSQAATQ